MSIISVFEMFSVGIGPSSSHTVGPMRAAYHFSQMVKNLEGVHHVETDLYGSLALTGEGHATPKAVLMGLEGELPHLVNPSTVVDRVIDIRTKKRMNLAGNKMIVFDNNHLRLKKTETLPYHSNGMKFIAYDDSGNALLEKVYYSIGGGFIVQDSEINLKKEKISLPIPFPYHTASQLMSHCKTTNLNIYELQIANEQALGR